MANASILAAFERMWQHVTAALGDKSDSDHTHSVEDVTNLQSTLDAINEEIGTKVDKVDGMGLSSNNFTDEEKAKLNSPVSTTNVVHGDDNKLLSNIIETYILSIDYDKLLAFDTDEIIVDDITSPILGVGMLGYMVLA